MRKAVTVLLLGLVACLWHDALLHGAETPNHSSNTAGQCRSLVYSTNPQYPPYDWSVDGNAFDGASIELLKMAMPPGVRFEPLVIPWKRALHLARQGTIDLLVSLRITPERSEYLHFTTHRAFPNPIVLFVRKDKQFPYKQWDDLRDKKGGRSLGDTFGGGFDEYLGDNLQIQDAPSMQENFQKLEAGRIDYFITSLYVGKAYIATHRMKHEIVALSPPISEQDIHIGFSKLSPCIAILDTLSKNLAALDKQGVPEKLLEKHLKKYATTPQTP